MKKSTVIEDLHRTQEREKAKTYLESSKMQDVACECGVPAAQVYGVATFYTMFSAKPRGKHIIRICRNLACHLEGADAVVTALKKNLGVEPGGTSKDGEFTLEESSCLGLCAEAPAMMIDGAAYGSLTPESVGQILARVRKGD
jgi:NADH-quinone oxidoreductase subunit E